MAKPHTIAQHYFESAQDIQFYYTGTEQCLPGHCWGPGIKDHYKIFYIHSGKGTFQTAGDTYHVTRGNAFLISPGKLSFYQADETDPWNYSWVAFDGAQMAHYLRQAGFTCSSPVKACSRDTEVRECLDIMFDANQQLSGNPLRVTSALYAFLAILTEPSPEEPCNPQKDEIKNAYVKQAICFIKANYHRPMTIEELAGELGLNRKYAAELFKTAVGMPPQQYLSKYRMDKACHFLRETELSVKEIAFSVGYTDQLLFSRMFKKIVGLSPTDYRHG